MHLRIPLVHLGKQPLGGESWKKRISDDPKEWTRWAAQGLNLGLPLEECGLSVVDFDEKEAARRFYKEHTELCRLCSETKRGLHVLFTGSTKTRKFEHGDIKGNGFIVVAPSWVYHKDSGETWKYRWIRNDGEPPPFPSELFPEPTKEIIRHEIKNIRSYLARIEAIKHQGKGWAAGLIRAASCCRDSGLSEAQAVVALIEWNNGPTVDPKYPLNELARAVSNVFKKGQSNDRVA